MTPITQWEHVVNRILKVVPQDICSQVIKLNTNVDSAVKGFGTCSCSSKLVDFKI